MPTYLYKCTVCNQEKEVEQKITEQPLTHCPFCNQECFKRIPPRGISIQFKGSGFYGTDYKNPPPESSGGGCGKPSCKCH